MIVKGYCILAKNKEVSPLKKGSNLKGYGFYCPDDFKKDLLKIKKRAFGVKHNDVVTLYILEKKFHQHKYSTYS